jgi:hypothetical protein
MSTPQPLVSRHRVTGRYWSLSSRCEGLSARSARPLVIAIPGKPSAQIRRHAVGSMLATDTVAARTSFRVARVLTVALTALGHHQTDRGRTSCSERARTAASMARKALSCTDVSRQPGLDSGCWQTIRSARCPSGPARHGRLGPSTQANSLGAQRKKICFDGDLPRSGLGRCTVRMPAWRSPWRTLRGQD